MSVGLAEAIRAYSWLTGYAEVMRWRVLVRMERFELSWVSPPPPQDGVSASFTTSAIHELKLETQTKGGLGDLNYSITLITRNLLIVHPA